MSDPETLPPELGTQIDLVCAARADHPDTFVAAPNGGTAHVTFRRSAMFRICGGLSGGSMTSGVHLPVRALPGLQASRCPEPADIHAALVRIYWVPEEVEMAKTLIDVDEEYLAAAQEVLHTQTKKDTVNAALREVAALAARRRDLQRLESGGLPDLEDEEVMRGAWRQ
jgi:Arc/MetJ family transcription regulator